MQLLHCTSWRTKKKTWLSAPIQLTKIPKINLFNMDPIQNSDKKVHPYDFHDNNVKWKPI